MQRIDIFWARSFVKTPVYRLYLPKQGAQTTTPEGNLALIVVRSKRSSARVSGDSGPG